MSSILDWLSGVKIFDDDDDPGAVGHEQDYFGPCIDSPGSELDPDDEQPAPVMNKEGLLVGVKSANGRWGLSKQDKFQARLDLRREVRPIQKKLRRKANKRKGREQARRDAGLPPLPDVEGPPGRIVTTDATYSPSSTRANVSISLNTGFRALKIANGGPTRGENRKRQKKEKTKGHESKRINTETEVLHSAASSPKRTATSTLVIVGLPFHPRRDE